MLVLDANFCHFDIISCILGLIIIMCSNFCIQNDVINFYFITKRKINIKINSKVLVCLLNYIYFCKRIRY